MNEPVRILLVEDNPGDARLIAEMLKEEGGSGFGITPLSRLDEAITKLGKPPQFDLVMLDLGLPDSAGLDTFLKTREAAPGIPIVILTGNDDQELASAAVRSGAQDYLVKGKINSEVLVRSIKYAIERFRISSQIIEKTAKLELSEALLKKRERHLTLLSQMVISSQEAERKRLSRELHDSLGQKIISIQLEVEWLKNRESVKADKDVYINMIKLTVDASDELQQICMGLRPLILDKIGFYAAIKSLLEEFETNSDIVIETRIMPVDETSISPDTTINLYRIIQESLTNVVRHSNSKTVFISLREEVSELVLEVKDEGCGLPEDASSNTYGFGILGMRERANMSGGRFEIDFIPGKGTHIKVSVPFSKPVGGPSV